MVGQDTVSSGGNLLVKCSTMYSITKFSFEFVFVYEKYVKAQMHSTTENPYVRLRLQADDDGGLVVMVIVISGGDDRDDGDNGGGGGV